MKLRIRPHKPEDVGFIIDAWRNSFEGSPAVRGAHRDHFRLEMIRMIHRLLDKCDVRIACDPKDEDTIVGFAAFSGTELHYIYVKKDFRGHGIARDLLEGVPIATYTFRVHGPKAPPRGWAFTPRFTI